MHTRDEASPVFFPKGGNISLSIMKLCLLVVNLLLQNLTYLRHVNLSEEVLDLSQMRFTSFLQSLHLCS